MNPGPIGRRILMMGALALVGACRSSAPLESTAPNTDSGEIPYSIHRSRNVIPISGKHPRLVVDNPHGDIRLRPASERVFEVLAVSQRLGLQPEAESIIVDGAEEEGRVTVRYPSDESLGVDHHPEGHRKGRVDLVVFVPPGTRAELIGLDDAIQARRVDGDVRARVRAGKISVSVWGGAELSSVSGDIHLTLMKPRWGAASVRSESGAVAVYWPESADPDLDLTGARIDNQTDLDLDPIGESGQERVRRNGFEGSRLTVRADRGIVILRSIRY